MLGTTSLFGVMLGQREKCGRGMQYLALARRAMRGCVVRLRSTEYVKTQFDH